MPPSAGPSDFEALGLSPDRAGPLAARVNAALGRHPDRTDPGAQMRLWLEFREILDAAPPFGFPIHLRLYRLAYEGRRAADGPAPAWVPSSADLQESHIGAMMRARGTPSYRELHRWSVEHREQFWSDVLGRLRIVFRTPPAAVLAPNSDPARPDWLPGARMNIAESALRGDPEKVAIVSASEGSSDLRRVTYDALKRLAARVANGLESIGTRPGDRVALYLPMTPEAVAIYLGVILAGRCVVGIADASAGEEFEKRARIAGASLAVTVDRYRRDGKSHAVYEKIVESNGPRAVVLPGETGAGVRVERPGDVTWEDFLDREGFEPVPCRPSDPTNILFSSGTTKDPKAIPWTHTTPIKAAADAYLHLDVGPSDVLAWPTSFGWMMGPWLTYASLVNGATMALYVGGTGRREFGEFVSDTGVTMLGVVPKLVRSWLADGTMEGLDWSRVRRFASTAEPSSPDEMLYLMHLAGYKPVIEYCGGTEIGGAYLTGTMVQPAAPSTFTTAALGLEVAIRSEGQPADRGEVFLLPPSIGLSNDLLNYDHFQEYFAGVPKGPNGEVMRRHGDQLERLGGGYFRHHGRIDDVININGVKTSAEEIRSVIGNDLVYDAKPVAVDVDGSGQRRLVVYAVPRDAALIGSSDLRRRLREEYQRAIKDRLNPLLAHVEDVVLVAELPQAGPGKTRTMDELGRDYRSRTGRA